MKTNSIAWIIGFILIALAIVFVGKKAEMFSAYPNTASWHFKSGCTGDKCYSGSYNIGELIFSTPVPIYLKDKAECKFDKEWVAFPEPSLNCWIQNFTFAGVKYTIKPYETIKLNKYIEVEWIPSGFIFNGQVCHNVCSGSGKTRTCEEKCKVLDYAYDWQDPEYTNDFIFSFYDMSWFKNTIKDKHLADTINDEAYVTYELYDDLTNIDGGAVIRENFELWSPTNSEKQEYFKVYKGTKVYKTSISTETLGDQDISITPFAIVIDKQMGSTSSVYIYTNEDSKSLRILPNLQNVGQQDSDFWLRNVPTQTPPNAVDDNSEGTPQPDRNWIWWVVGIVLLLSLIYLVKENYEKK